MYQQDRGCPCKLFVPLMEVCEGKSCSEMKREGPIDLYLQKNIKEYISTCDIEINEYSSVK
jgi:hypothetical protein